MKDPKDIISNIYPVSGTSLVQILDIIEYQEFAKGSCFIEMGIMDASKFPGLMV